MFSAFATPYLFGGDTRFRATPPIAEVDAVTLPAFQSYWQQRLNQGPVKVGVVGDFDRDAIIAAVAKSFGTLPSRENVPLDAAQRAVSASLPAADPVVLRHRGDPTQAMVARIWPTQGLFDDVTTGRALELAASLIQTRLTEDFRETQGGSYAPFVSYNYGGGDIPHYGALVAGAQLRTDRMADFEAALTAVITDIAAHGGCRCLCPREGDNGGRHRARDKGQRLLGWPHHGELGQSGGSRRNPGRRDQPTGRDARAGPSRSPSLCRPIRPVI
ncbi:hypothetical protein GCM10020258_39240 [Sphingomonas yabuuchiae]